MKKSGGGAIPSDYFKPSGTLSITENGLYDVKSYASTSVNVVGGGMTIDDYAEEGFPPEIYLSTASYVRSEAFQTMPIVSIDAPNVVQIGPSAFGGCYYLTTVDFPAATMIGDFAFTNCGITSVSFPMVTSIGDYAFNYCSALSTVNLPVATTIGSNAFGGCYYLTTVNLPVATTIGSAAFANCGLAAVSLPAAISIGNNTFN